PPPRLMNLTPPRPAKVTSPRLAKVMPPRPAKVMPPRPAKSEKIKHMNDYLCSNISFKLDDSTYDPLEDDDYNVDEGRLLNNFSEENSEWCEENDFNEYENPGQRQERLNQN
ncbi:43751_t:CDS:2, partial [Gigaspora margarita]